MKDREIKFRAWDEEDNNWFEEPQTIAYIAAVYFDSTIDDKIVWQQYTGLKDKNEREIYEGDILQDSDGEWVVKYTSEQTAFIVSSLSDDVDDGLSLGQLDREIEVIGNCFENPELLEAPDGR